MPGLGPAGEQRRADQLFQRGDALAHRAGGDGQFVRRRARSCPGAPLPRRRAGRRWRGKRTSGEAATSAIVAKAGAGISLITRCRGEQRQFVQRAGSSACAGASAAGAAGRADRSAAPARQRARRAGAVRRLRSTRLRHSPAARRMVRASMVCEGRVRSRVTDLKSSKRSLMPMVLLERPLRARSPASPTQLGEDGRERGAVAHGVQVALEGGLAADRDRLAVRHHLALVAAVRCRAASARSWRRSAAPGRPGRRRRCRPPCVQAEPGQLLARLRPDAVDLARRQRPDARRDVLEAQQGQAVGLCRVPRPAWTAACWA